MKKIILITALALAMPFLAKAQKIEWMDFEEAVELNKTEPKFIFIDCYTEWCGWCKKMDQTTFKDADVIEYMNEHFHAVKFDAERMDTIVFQGYTFVNKTPQGASRKNPHELAQALLQGKMSYPSYVVMNKESQLLTVIPGYLQAKEFIKILKFFGSEAYLNTKWEDFQKEE